MASSKPALGLGVDLFSLSVRYLQVYKGLRLNLRYNLLLWKDVVFLCLCLIPWLKDLYYVSETQTGEDLRLPAGILLLRRHTRCPPLMMEVVGAVCSLWGRPAAIISTLVIYYKMFEKKCWKMFIASSQSTKWHLEIAPFVQPRVQNPKTRHLLSWKTNYSSKPLNLRSWHQLIFDIFARKNAQNRYWLSVSCQLFN